MAETDNATGDVHKAQAKKQYVQEFSMEYSADLYIDPHRHLSTFPSTSLSIYA